MELVIAVLDHFLESRRLLMHLELVLTEFHELLVKTINLNLHSADSMVHLAHIFCFGKRLSSDLFIRSLLHQVGRRRVVHESLHLNFCAVGPLFTHLVLVKEVSNGS